MAQSPDQARRLELNEAVLKDLEAATDRTGSVQPDLVRENNPALDDVLDEFILSKSWRTDPETTAKQVAEAIVAHDDESKFAELLSTLENELKRQD
jgi:hypothetical protein